MSGVEDLRAVWPTLSPRERDARVAQVLGHVLSDPGLFGGAQFIRQEPDTEHETCLPIPPYSESWEHSGFLLERLREEGWAQIDVRFSVDAGVWRCHIYSGAALGYHEFHVQGETAPSAIALAFCLSREIADA